MKKIRTFLDYILHNWTIITFWISILATIITYCLTIVIPKYNASTELFITFGYSAVISIFFLLLEIRKLFKEDSPKSIVFDNMNAAQSSIFKTIIAHLSLRNPKPVVLRIYGMRLLGISRTLMDFINSTHDITWQRDLSIYIYHCDPDYLGNLTPGNVDEESKTEINAMFKEQSKAVSNNIDILRRAGKRNKRIKIFFRKYHSIPSFWAYEIEKSEVFFGYFTWTKKDWIGPENNCIFINRNSQQIKGFVDWINNYLDGLEDWSVAYE